MEMCVCGFVKICVCEFVEMCCCVFVEMWFCGNVGLWICGNVVSCEFYSQQKNEEHGCYFRVLRVVH